METSPFRLPKVTPFRLLERAAERVTGLHTLDNYYQQLPKHLNSKAFLRRTLETLNHHYNLSSGHLSGIPVAGPLIIVAESSSRRSRRGDFGRNAPTSSSGCKSTRQSISQKASRACSSVH